MSPGGEAAGRMVAGRGDCLGGFSVYSSSWFWSLILELGEGRGCHSLTESAMGAMYRGVSGKAG